MSTRDITGIDHAFGHWLAGFADGEGCFQIEARRDATCICTFSIALRIDDRAILEEIHRRLDIGRLSIRRKHAPGAQEQMQWSLSSKRDTSVLVAIFERYPLRAKKARDFAVWAEAVRCWADMSQRGMGRSERHDWTRVRELRTQLMALHAFDGSVHPPTLAAVPDDPQIALGFEEAA